MSNKNKQYSNYEIGLKGLPEERSCPNCGSIIWGFPGSQDSICRNCGFKDPCCE